MFGNSSNFFQQIERVQKLMKDENFKAFVSHPKVQTLFADPEFRKALQSQNPQTILNHPKMAALKDDPEIRALISKLDFKNLMG